jgi:single-stranded DNA-binding protein
MLYREEGGNPMANGLNKVMLIGNLGKDPDMRYTPNGKAVTTFSLAVNRTVRGADGQKHYLTEVIAQELLMLDPRPGGNGVHAAVAEDSADGLGF